MDDLRVDFLVFYRIEDIWELDGPTFMKLATRTFAFKGVNRLWAEAEAYAEQKKGKSAGRQGPGATPASDKVNKPVAALMVDPETSDLFEMG